MDSEAAGYSERFLAFLAREASEWHAAAKPDVEAAGAYLVEVESPNDNASASLWISTEDEEITVGFDAFHSHFETWHFDSEEKAFREALALARSIVAEKVLIASWWKDEKWSGSQLIELGEEVKRSDRTPADACLRIRSWTGKYDREEKG